MSTPGFLCDYTLSYNTTMGLFSTTTSISSFNTLHLLLLYSSDGACRHIGAALIELEDTLRQNEVITCTGEKCVWKRRKRTHNEACNLEDMTFTKPEIGKKKKKVDFIALYYQSLHCVITSPRLNSCLICAPNSVFCYLYSVIMLPQFHAQFVYLHVISPSVIMLP